jgi:hypothetical protein
MPWKSGGHCCQCCRCEPSGLKKTIHMGIWRVRGFTGGIPITFGAFRVNGWCGKPMVSRSDDDLDIAVFLHIYVSLRERTIVFCVSLFVLLCCCVGCWSSVGTWTCNDILAVFRGRDQSSEINREPNNHTGLKWPMGTQAQRDGMYQ